MKRFFWIALPVLLLAAGCNEKVEPVKPEPEPVEFTTLKVNLSSDVTRTTLGPSDGTSRPMYWVDGDRIKLNGVTSDPLDGVGGSSSAIFTIEGKATTPYKILYPASFWKDDSTITLPGTQAWASGSIATDTAPLSGYSTSGDAVSLSHLCTILQISLKKDAAVSASSISTITFKGNNGEQVCGDFTIDYSGATLTPAGSGSTVTLNVGQALSESDNLDMFLVVPARTYTKGFTVEMEDNLGRTMTKIRSGNTILGAGKLVKFKAFTFKPSPETTEFTIEPITEEVIPPDNFNIMGYVKDNAGNPVEGVVVSDGLQCVRTNMDGSFYLESNISKTKFVFISTPTGYLPEVSGGIPRHYKLLSSVSPSGGIYNMGNYVLTPVSNPNRFTLLITADPQPRKNNWTLDKVAYKSLDACQDLYQELYDVSQAINDRQVYGICLGDIVHEDMSLYAQYNSALATLAYPTYNIIGNHDNDPSAADDDAAAAPFESYYGPRNYSFNIGGIHFVVLDNLIMKENPSENNLTSFDQGLTDDIWTWLQADMAMIPTTTKIMVCAHSPMFKYISGSERTNTAKHGGSTNTSEGGAYGYGDLFDQYPEVHAWAGHTHVGFNFIYSSTHRHRNVQVHTLARSTGELWTNEYLAAGTPRGFTIVEVDNGNISWKFHPVTRQRGAFQGVTSGYCSAGAPAYTWRDWDYNGSGVAVMRNGGGALDESYQLHAYPRGTYDDSYVYANVFLWDENWALPVWTPDGGSPVTMTRIYTSNNHDIISDTDKVYDYADTEFRTWYKEHANKSGGSLHALDGYRTVDTDKITTIFRAPESAAHASGTVSVTDRFGNTYSRPLSW